MAMEDEEWTLDLQFQGSRFVLKRPGLVPVAGLYRMASGAIVLRIPASDAREPAPLPVLAPLPLGKPSRGRRSRPRLKQ